MPESKRRTLTPAERVAKLEAELAEAKKKADQQRDKKAAVLREKLSTLKAKQSKLSTDIDQVKAELAALVSEPADFPNQIRAV